MASHGFAQDDFNTSLFGCFHDVPSFLDGLFCPCCAVSAQYNMLKHRRTGGIPHVYLPLFILNFFTWGLALSIFSVVTRNMLRRIFFFTQETELSSCCKAFLCSPCSICQVYRELSIRHAWPDGVCVDVPYVRHGLVVPPPNPDSMGVVARVQPNVLHLSAVEAQQPTPVVYGYPMYPDTHATQGASGGPRKGV